MVPYRQYTREWFVQVCGRDYNYLPGHILTTAIQVCVGLTIITFAVEETVTVTCDPFVYNVHESLMHPLPSPVGGSGVDSRHTVRYDGGVNDHNASDRGPATIHRGRHQGESVVAH